MQVMVVNESINVQIGYDKILPQLNKKIVAEYFKLDCFDDETPLSLIEHFKQVTGNKRPMTPEDIKKLICCWIDENLFNCI